jgi:hypothetical protein
MRKRFRATCKGFNRRCKNEATGSQGHTLSLCLTVSRQIGSRKEPWRGGPGFQYGVRHDGRFILVGIMHFWRKNGFFSFLSPGLGLHYDSDSIMNLAALNNS